MLTTTEFDILASGWGNRADLVAPGTGWFDIPVMSGIASAVVQCFYAWRLYALSKSVPLVVVIVVLALTESAAALALGIIVHTTIHSLLVLQSNTYAVTGVWLIGSATCDLVISVSSLWLLSRARRRVAEGNKTRGFINRIIILTVGGGFLTASVAIVDAILYLGFPENNLHFAAAFLLPKLYTNALMVILNNRIRNLNNLTYTWEGEAGEGDSSDASPRNIDLTSLDGSIDSILNAGSRSADVSLGTEHTNRKPEAGG
ncbi:hypothetical protein D9757_008122 [Collybiopsis confluens]|nr:hypothetical protein D9757_008122 [Collybiopsis confluens]